VSFTVAPNNIVRADVKGRIFYAHVTGEPESGRYPLRPITPGVTYFTASRREIRAAWGALASVQRPLSQDIVTVRVAERTILALLNGTPHNGKPIAVEPLNPRDHVGAVNARQIVTLWRKRGRPSGSVTRRAAPSHRKRR